MSTAHGFDGVLMPTLKRVEYILKGDFRHLSLTEPYLPKGRVECDFNPIHISKECYFCPEIV
jgi:hypothetical protein